MVNHEFTELPVPQERLDRKANENVNAESELVSLRIRGKVSEEAYERQMTLLLAERKWISEERERINQRLAFRNPVKNVAVVQTLIVLWGLLVLTHFFTVGTGIEELGSGLLLGIFDVVIAAGLVYFYLRGEKAN